MLAAERTEDEFAKAVCCRAIRKINDLRPDGLSAGVELGGAVASGLRLSRQRNPMLAVRAAHQLAAVDDHARRQLHIKKPSMVPAAFRYGCHRRTFALARGGGLSPHLAAVATCGAIGARRRGVVAGRASAYTRPLSASVAPASALPGPCCVGTVTPRQDASFRFAAGRW
jgi:hypothetical protein